MSQEIEQKTIPNVKPIGKDEPNVPALRYKKIKEISDKIEYGLGSSAVPFDGMNLYIRITDIDETTGTLSSKKVSPSSYSKEYVLNLGDILIARTGASVGKSYIHDGSKNCYFAGFLMRIEVINHNSYYIYQQFKTQKFKKWLDIMSMRSGQPGINAKELGLYRVKVDDRNKEDRISILLKSIDSRINTQKKIIEDYEFIMKRIRTNKLNKFQMDYEKIQLANVLVECSEKTIKNDMYHVLSSTKSGIYLQEEYFNKEASSDDTTGYKVLKRGYATYRSMSDTGEFTFNIQNIINCGIISPAYPVFNVNDGTSLQFVIEYLNYSSSFNSQILASKEGGTRFALSFSKLKKLFIPDVPNHEQLEYCECINSLKKYIDNEKKILSLLLQQKQYLLNKLFI